MKSLALPARASGSAVLTARTVREAPPRPVRDAAVSIAAAAVILSASVHPALAVGLESFDLTPSLQAVETPENYRSGAQAQAEKIKAADAGFEECELAKMGLLLAHNKDA
jgi:hypothetical protein